MWGHRLSDWGGLTRHADLAREKGAGLWQRGVPQLGSSYDTGSQSSSAEGFWGSGHVLFLDLGVGFMSVFSLWKFTELFTYNKYTFLCVCYTAIKNSKMQKVTVTYEQISLLSPSYSDAGDLCSLLWETLHRAIQGLQSGKTDDQASFTQHIHRGG